ncbi:GyrI-like domain-containing protein [Parafilimonas terrae]|nr:GyrI-like domain-containing protein [Parafilimonas terrae]
MKKLTVAILVVLLLVFAIIYFLIPPQFTVSNTILLKANPNSIYRCLSNEAKWEKILEEEGSADNPKQKIKIGKKLMGSMEVQIKDKGSSFPGLIEILALKNDSAAIKWTLNVERGPGLFKRIQNYFIAKKLKNSTAGILGNVKKFLEKTENIYDIQVQMVSIKDTLLVAIKTTSKNYPGLQEVYGRIDKLQNYATANGAVQTGYPMLSVRTGDSINFEIITGLPISKDLKGSGIILHKEMPSTGRMLATNEIKGGPYTIKKAFNNLEDFFEDHKFISPAVPFESLITNRMQEKDTSKWVTKIYYPVY